MKFKFHRLGLVPFPKEQIDWADNSLLQPTPILIDDETIRVFCGMRDKDGVGKIGYLDLSAADPTHIKSVSKTPVLEPGLDGRFDDNGVVPCVVIKVGDEYRIYYAGYQLGTKVRFTSFCGLAVSSDGTHFERYRQTPILDRTHEEPLFRVIHSMVPDPNSEGFLLWYGGGGGFAQSSQKTLPVYNIRHMRTEDGLTFPGSGELAVDIQGDEYRIGRPYVVKTNDGYIMFYGYGSEDRPYNLGMAVSSDGRNWIRQDDALSLSGEEGAWENEMRAYPAFIKTKYGHYFFYNGNNYGRDGFGCCRVEGFD
jgi:predicted GH43/DUF377 family glycosyl hydrolase